MNIIYNNAKYELTAVNPSQYPLSILPEVVFAGRSNVGKSSLINSLVNRRGLARIASTPGKTRGLNFYNIDEKLYFVDIPGYGYASVSKEQIASWSTMVDTYLNTRIQLKLIIMIVDIRHAPSSNDKIMYEWIISKKKPHVIVATKLDKISKSQIDHKISIIRKTLLLSPDIPIVKFSSLSKIGITEAWNEIIRNIEDSNEM